MFVPALPKQKLIATKPSLKLWEVEAQVEVPRLEADSNTGKGYHLPAPRQSRLYKKIEWQNKLIATWRLNKFMIDYDVLCIIEVVY